VLRISPPTSVSDPTQVPAGAQTVNIYFDPGWIASGQVGTNSLVSEVLVGRDQTPQDVIRQLMRSQLDHGFKQMEEVNQSTLIVQYPPDHFEDMDHVLRVWDVVPRVLNDELGWAGLGRCVNVDYSSENSTSLLWTRTWQLPDCGTDWTEKDYRISQ
jgi:hypothetical protein